MSERLPLLIAVNTASALHKTLVDFPSHPPDPLSAQVTASHTRPAMRPAALPLVLSLLALPADLADTGRPASAPPPAVRSVSQPSTSPPSVSAIPSRILNDSSVLPNLKNLPSAQPLDQMPQLQRSGPTIVKTRTGSVLSRGLILKTDHYPSGIRFMQKV